MRKATKAIKGIRATLQKAVAAGQCGLMSAYHLSFLPKDKQLRLAEALAGNIQPIRIEQAAALRKLPDSDWVHLEAIIRILNEKNA